MKRFLAALVLATVVAIPLAHAEQFGKCQAYRLSQATPPGQIQKTFAYSFVCRIDDAQGADFAQALSLLVNAYSSKILFVVPHVNHGMTDGYLVWTEHPTP